MKTCSVLLAALLAVTSLSAGTYDSTDVKVPKLKMKQNGLPFDLIEGYPDYKIVATHFRTDKNELRYILANPIAYNALNKGKLPLPEGSKIVKIGWDVEKMELFPAALEANKVQRVEYMYKDSKNFDQNGDNWGYARFVKKGNGYESWGGKTEECVACHSVAQGNDYLFTKMQNMFE